MTLLVRWKALRVVYSEQYPGVTAVLLFINIRAVPSKENKKLEFTLNNENLQILKIIYI